MPRKSSHFITDLIRYLFFSKRKQHYTEIAKGIGVSPFFVYRLAHGKKTRSASGVAVLKELKKAEIVKEVSEGISFE